MRKDYIRKAIKKADRLLVNLRDGIKCYECETVLEASPKENGKVIGGQHHHIIPMIYGGSNNASNMVLLCEECHLAVHSGTESFGEKYFRMYQNFINGKKLMNL